MSVVETVTIHEYYISHNTFSYCKPSNHQMGTGPTSKLFVLLGKRRQRMWTTSECHCGEPILFDNFIIYLIYLHKKFTNAVRTCRSPKLFSSWHWNTGTCFNLWSSRCALARVIISSLISLSLPWWCKLKNYQSQVDFNLHYNDTLHKASGWPLFCLRKNRTRSCSIGGSTGRFKWWTGVRICMIFIQNFDTVTLRTSINYYTPLPS